MYTLMLPSNNLYSSNILECLLLLLTAYADVLETARKSPMDEVT